MQVHGGLSLTMGWASGSRSFRETGAWVSYFDPVTGLGLSFSYSHSSGDLLGNYHGGGYSAPYLYSSPLTSLNTADRMRMDQNEFAGDGASLRGPALVAYPGYGVRR